MVKTRPSYIAVEDLNVSGMMKNRHLSKAVASQKFYEFRTKLKNKCDENGIELRIVDRWYPSSKLCHRCGSVRKDLKLSDRTYECECGHTHRTGTSTRALTYETPQPTKPHINHKTRTAGYAGTYDCGVYKNLQVARRTRPRKHTRRNSKKQPRGLHHLNVYHMSYRHIQTHFE